MHQSIFERIASPENLFAAWDEFRRGKRRRNDVATFEVRLEEHVLALYRELASGAYRHGPYTTFTVCDPKPRHIHKAPVRDRLVHHAVVRVLAPMFDRTFIAHSFSCRLRKGTHEAVKALHRMLWTVSRNGTRPCFTLQCDVQRFFASVHHGTLLSLLSARVREDRVIWLLREIIGSHCSQSPGCAESAGLPIGNVTSQLFANVYLHELDQFVKHTLRLRSYVRYTDDFIIVSHGAQDLLDVLPRIEAFLDFRLRLRLHPRKVRLRKFRQGVDFLGYVLLPHCRVLRTSTKRRMFRRLRACAEGWLADPEERTPFDASLQSYLGVLSHADTFGLRKKLLNDCWLWMMSRAGSV